MSKKGGWPKGRPFSDKHKKNISLAKQGEKHPMFGKHFSDKHKKKLSESLKGIRRSEKTKKKMSLVAQKRIREKGSGYLDRPKDKKTGRFISNKR